MTAFVFIYDSVTAFPCSLLFQNKNPKTLSSLPCRAVVSTHVSRYLRKLSMKNWDEGERKYFTFPAQKPTKQEKVTTSQIYMYVFIHLCRATRGFVRSYVNIFSPSDLPLLCHIVIMLNCRHGGFVFLVIDFRHKILCFFTRPQKKIFYIYFLVSEVSFLLRAGGRDLAFVLKSFPQAGA